MSASRVKARNAAAESGGGGAEAGGGGGRTGKGSTQTLGPGENPYAMEGGAGRTGKGSTQELSPGEGPSCEADVPTTQSKPGQQGKIPIKTKSQLNDIAPQHDAIKNRIEQRIKMYRSVEKMVNGQKGGPTPEQQKAVADRYWKMAGQNGKDFHDMVHFYDKYVIQSQPLTAGSLVPERP